MAKTAINKVKVDRMATAYFIVLAVSLFVAYPRVLLYPPGVSSESHFLNGFGTGKVSLEDVAIPFASRFPVELLVGALSLFFLAASFFTFKKIPRKLIFSLVLFLLAVFGSVMVNGGLPEDILVKVNYVMIPLAVAFAVLRTEVISDLREKSLFVSLGLLWFVSIFWSFLSDRPIGISGNQNWFVAVVLATSPGAFFVLYYIFKSLLKRLLTNTNVGVVAAVVSTSIVGSVSVYWFIRSHSRAAWLALAFYLIFLLFLKCGSKGRGVVLLVGVVLSLVIFFTFKPLFFRAYDKDIRGPLWLNTVKMASKSPYIGWGPGKFQEKYPQFKTREHSAKLVAALMTEHPHNEFLYLSSELGLPAALVWLSLLILLFFTRVRSFEGHVAKFGFIILSVHCMFDKTLIAPPGNFLFWVFGGILAARWLKNIIVFAPPPKVWTVLIALVAVCLFSPVFLRTVSIYQAGEIQRQTTLLLRSLASAKLTGVQRKNLYVKVYKGYMAAFDKNPFRVEYPYMAVHVALEILNDTALAERPLERCFALNPNYAHLNYLAALYHFQKMLDSQGNPELSVVHKNQVKIFLMKELRLNPDNLTALSHVLEVFVKINDRLAVNEIFRIISNRAVEKFKSKYSATDAEKALHAWVRLVRDNDTAAVAQAQQLLSGFKGIGQLDVLTPFYAAEAGYLLEHDHQYFHPSDFDYWRAVYQLSELYQQEKSVRSLCQELMNKFSITRGDRFTWPSEVFAAKKGNELSVVSFMAAVARSRGYLSLIVKITTSEKAHWALFIKNEHEGLICWPAGKKLIDKKSDTLLTTPEFIEEMIEDKVISRELFLFEYPQAFCLRNFLLSKIVNRFSEAFPDFCFPPSVVKLNLESYFGGKISINYLRQPFYRLEEDLSKVTR